MDSSKTLPVRGRGALIAKAIKQAEEAKVSQEAVRPRGRAALLEQLKKKTISQVGNAEVEACPIQTNAQASSFVEEVSEKMNDLEISKPEQPALEYKGVSGTQVPASANYIQLKLLPNHGVFEYEVKFSPEQDSKSARSKILNQCLDRNKTKIFDGIVLYLPEKIVDTRKVFDCEHPFNKEPVQCTIIFKKQKKMDECLHLYNVLFKRIMFILQYKRVGRQFFDNKQPFMVPQHKLEIWPGYVVSVNEYSDGIMLCMDVQHRLLRTQNALQFIYEVIETNRAQYKRILEKAFIGAVVLTRYNNKTYIIHDIMWNSSPKSKFTLANGTTISYIDYYKNQYNITITDLEQPMLIHRQTVAMIGSNEMNDRLIILVPELCYLTGLTDEMRSDFRVMKDIALFTRVTPNQRMNSLKKFIANVNETQEAKDILSAWGLLLHFATIDLQMRVLQPEDILFGNDVTIHGTPQADWTSAAMKNRVLVSVDFKNWMLIYTSQDRRCMEEFVQNIQRLGPRMGVSINQPRLMCAPDDKNETYIRILQEHINNDLQIVVIICPTNRDDRYMTIKKICCAKSPIPSQVINSKTLKNPKKLPAIAQKIALQMNVKLGGSLWSCRFPFKKWMICGIDTFHSTTLSGQAVAALISSLNESMSTYYSKCCFHDKDKEIGDHLKVMFFKALQEYYKANSFYPDQVVIYRDGVGDGQMNYVSKFEIPQFLTVFQELGMSIKLTYIIVQKRISTRIFKINKHHADEENPPAGSIVDDTITRKYLYDFFLVAQQVRQGTVTPTHYVVLYDDAHIKPDYVQRLTYKMCHMYYNWTGTIRIPAPCQYAHKLAYLIGQSVRTEHSSKLSHTLFYL